MSEISQSYTALVERLREIATVSSIGALLGWDQQIYMPARGQTARAEQAALVARLAHEKLVGNEMADLLHSLESKASELTPDETAVVRETRRVHDRQKKLPVRL